MEVDDGREIFRKQLVASEEAGHYEKMRVRTKRTNAQMRAYKESEKRRMLETPPVKVDDSPEFGLEDVG